MSESPKGAEMSAPKSSPCFFDTIAGCLEDRMSHGDTNGCLEVIKFLRRFIQKVPVTDYRTVGRPDAIIGFLEACGLKPTNDFNIEVSSLDGNSHVLSFKKNSRVIEMLGKLAGMRVTSGPSICDTLYCEMIKESGRDFFAAIRNACAAINKMPDLRGYILDRTELIYNHLSNILDAIEAHGVKSVTEVMMPSSDGVSADERIIMEFARTQVSNHKLLPTATPVVPLAVAELYQRIMTWKISGKFVPSILKPGANPADWTAARPVSVSGLAPDNMTATAPARIMRETFDNFDQFMPVDACSFSTTTGSSGHATDAVYVTFGAPLRVPGDDINQTVDTFNVINNRCSLMTKIRQYYSECYPDLGIAFYTNSAVSVLSGSKVSSKPMSDRDVKAGKELGIEPSECGRSFVVTGALIFSPFSESESVDDLFESSSTILMNARIGERDDVEKGYKSKSGDTMADLWYETVHNTSAPHLTEKEASEKMHDILVAATNTTESGNLPTAVAIGIRTAISKQMEKSGSSSIKSLPINKHLEETDPGLLHTKDKFVTQLISTVAGPGERSIESFVKDTDSGKVVLAPGFPKDDRLFSACSAMTVKRFIDIADTTGLQLRMPRKASDFIIYAETNISYDTLTQLYENTSGLTNTINDIMAREIGIVLFSSIAGSVKSWKHYEHVIRKVGAKSRMGEVLNIIDKGLTKRSLLNVAIYENDCDRAVIGIRIDTSVAILAMMLRASDEDFAFLSDMAVKNDPSAVLLSQDHWRDELVEHLVSESRKRGHSSYDPLCELMNSYVADDCALENIVAIRNMFSENVVSDKFSGLAVTSCSDGTDPN